jgi:hypothetical protein
VGRRRRDARGRDPRRVGFRARRAVLRSVRTNGPVPHWYSLRAASVVGVLTTPLLVGSGCASDGPATGAGANDAGVGGNAGAAGSARAAGGSLPARRPPIPPATIESCGVLAFTFDEGDCTSVCASVRCECDPFPSTYIACPSASATASARTAPSAPSASNPNTAASDTAIAAEKAPARARAGPQGSRATPRTIASPALAQGPANRLEGALADRSGAMKRRGDFAVWSRASKI